MNTTTYSAFGQVINDNILNGLEWSTLDSTQEIADVLEGAVIERIMSIANNYALKAGVVFPIGTMLIIRRDNGTRAVVTLISNSNECEGINYRKVEFAEIPEDCTGVPPLF